MNLYAKKQLIKLLLIAFAFAIGISAIIYSNNIVSKLAQEERKKIQLWADALKEIQEIPVDGQVSPTLYKILEDNKTIPVLLIDEHKAIITSMNIPENDTRDSLKMKKILEKMTAEHDPIVINFSEGRKNFVYYADSLLLTLLFYYPFIQIAVVALFIGLSYIAFSNSRKAEQNRVWVGMSKETAHQLGTPISSLVAWLEIVKLKNHDEKLISEVEKDIRRLETITERFSKIGAAPKLENHDIAEVTKNALSYIKSRSSEKIEFKFDNKLKNSIQIPLNISLFEWVIENLCKNAIDAMQGSGKIETEISEKPEKIEIVITDTGKGIPKSKFKTVFKPGYTTKKRGWGLGLSLAKRIIEEYHHGKIYVKSSDINKYTSFCISLKKYEERI